MLAVYFGKGYFWRRGYDCSPMKGNGGKLLAFRQAYVSEAPELWHTSIQAMINVKRLFSYACKMTIGRVSEKVSTTWVPQSLQHVINVWNSGEI